MALSPAVLDQIVFHQMKKVEELEGPTTGSWYLNAKFLGMLVQLARPRSEARLMALRYALKLTVHRGRGVMRELRQTAWWFGLTFPRLKLWDRYVMTREELGGSQSDHARAEFGETPQDRDADLVAAFEADDPSTPEVSDEGSDEAE